MMEDVCIHCHGVWVWSGTKEQTLGSMPKEPGFNFSSVLVVVYKIGDSSSPSCYFFHASHFIGHASMIACSFNKSIITCKRLEKQVTH